MRSISTSKATVPAILAICLVLLPQFASANDQSYPYLAEGVRLVEAGSYGEAVSQFDQAIALDPGDSYAYYNKGYALLMLEDYWNALSSFNSALEINPSDGDALVNKAACLISLAKAGQVEDTGVTYGKAIEACNTAIQLDMGNKRAWYQRGMAYWGLGASNPDALDQAWGDFNYAYQIDPSYSLALEARDQLSDYMFSIGHQPSDDGGFQGGKGN
jgi:tetratricopeptide (TPR) repeat protein